MFTRKNAHSDFEISDKREYSKIVGTLPMTECLGLRRSKVKRDSVFYFMQPSTVIPVTFENNEIQTNMDGLLVYHDVLSDRKIFNCKAIGFRTIQLSYLDTPGTYVFRS